MTVQELIERLQNLENKEAEVCYPDFIDASNHFSIDTICELKDEDGNDIVELSH